MSDFQRVKLYWHTVRHLKLQQIVGRVAERVRRAFGRGMPADPPTSLQVASSYSIPRAPERLRAENRAVQDDIFEGTFTFLNVEGHLGRPFDWTPDMSALWTFHLHYFHYLPGLNRSLRGDLCREWIQANPVGSDPGWHPYPTSLRVINWCRAAPREPDILESLYRQASYLHRHPETYLLGNHLLENARALVFAGCFFGEQGEAPQWLERGLEIYRDQTPEQILDDGGHFERSPMYHALMLEGYVDVLNLLPEEHPDRSWMAETVREMSDFLLSMTHPQSRIGLFNDATRSEACSTDELLAYAGKVVDLQPERCSQFEKTGYYIHSSGDVYLIIDGGSIGPDHLPAHAHADIFSYELSVGGALFIVDTGVYEYKAGDMRDYVRSTRAHNTVCVDGVNQAECWDSFRVARRFPPRNVSFTQQGGKSRFEGRFDGYTQLIGDGIEHRRSVEADQNDRCIVVEDTATGEGCHSVESLIHLHPDVQVERNQDNICLNRAGHVVHVSASDSIVQFENGWYCPEFGKRIEQDVIALQSEGALPIQLTYRIHY